MNLDILLKLRIHSDTIRHQTVRVQYTAQLVSVQERLSMDSYIIMLLYRTPWTETHDVSNMAIVNIKAQHFSGSIHTYRPVNCACGLHACRCI